MKYYKSRVPVFGHIFGFTKDPLVFLDACRNDDQRVTLIDFAVTRGLLLHDSSDIERMCVDRDQTLLKPLWLTTPSVLRLLGRGMVNADGDDWKTQHDAAISAFMPASVESAIPEFERIADRVVENSPTFAAINLSALLRKATLSYVMAFVFGQTESTETDALTPHFTHLMNRFRRRSSLMGLRDVVLPLPPSRADRAAANSLRMVVRKSLRDQLKAGGVNPICPDLNAALSDDSSLETACEQLLSLLAAGHDSSSLALAWCCQELARRPDLVANLREEWNDAQTKTSCTSELPEYPLTMSVIKETLRLYPPIWIMGRRAARTFDFDGIEVRKGDHIIGSQWMTHRDSRYFSDPLTFDPGRWTISSSDSLAKYAWFPFGGGKRVCIGYRFAMVEMVIILRSLFGRYDVVLADTAAVPVASMTLRPSEDIFAELHPFAGHR